VLKTFLYNPEHDKLALRLNIAVNPICVYGYANQPGAVNAVSLLHDGLMKTAAPQPLAVETAAEIPQIAHRLPDIFLDGLEQIRLMLVCLQDYIDLYLRQAKDLSYVIMDFPADGVECLLLDLQLRLKRLLLELLAKLKQLLLLTATPAQVAKNKQ